MSSSAAPVREVITGNHAVSHGARLARVEVIAGYPITPQTQVVELLSSFCDEGVLEAKFIKVESEHSGMAALVGASSAGARTFTATSAQGLALMHEMLHWSAGARLPIVMANINRAMGAPWSVWADQNDSLSQRDTGWMQVYCESNQEVLDTVLHCYKVAETVSLPAMLVLDAFVLSHTAEPVDYPEPEKVDAFLPPYSPQHKLDYHKPMAFSGLTTPDAYMETRFKMQEAMSRAIDVFSQVDEEYGALFGRNYGLLETYRADGADLLLVTSGTITGTAREVVDQLRQAGRRVGLLKIRVFRPFPTEQVREVARSVGTIAVIDRNIGFGVGGIFAQEVRAALFNNVDKPVFGFVAGLGGRDVTPATILEIVDYVDSHENPKNLVWIGLKK